MKLDQIWDMLIEVRFNLRIPWKWRERAARLPIAPYVKCSHYFKQKQIFRSDNKRRAAHFLTSVGDSVPLQPETISLSSSRSFRTIWEAAYQQRKWSIWCGVLLRPRSWTCARGQTSTRWEPPSVYDSASYSQTLFFWWRFSFRSKSFGSIISLTLAPLWL